MQNARFAALSLAALSLATLALATLALSACSTTPKEPDPVWVESEMDAVSRQLLWELSTVALSAANYQVGAGADPSRLELKSGWQTHLAPFSGKGFRRRAEVRFEALGDRRYGIGVRVARQANMAVADPLDPRMAEWEWRADDTDAARILLQRIKSTAGAQLEFEDLDAPGRQP
jgi:hypothetical protein